MRPLDGSSTSPTALTAISAPTVTPPTVSDALPMPPFGALRTVQLAHRGAGAGADVAFLDWAGARGLAGLIARRRVRPHRGVAHAQVEQDRRRHDGHMGHAHVETDLAFFQVAHHAAGRVQAERAAAGQHHGVHFLDHVGRIEQVGLARAGRRAAHVHARRGAGLGDDHRAAGRPPRVRVVPDLQPRHLGDGPAARRQP